VLLVIRDGATSKEIRPLIDKRYLHWSMLEDVSADLRALIWPAPQPVEPDGARANSEDHKQTPPNKYSEDFSSVIWNGEFYEFTHGQAAAVKILWRNWENETPVVSETTILDKSGSTADRLSDVFDKGKNPAWGPMIVPGSRKGTFRLVEAD
jgi:hypothetical protein